MPRTAPTQKFRFLRPFIPRSAQPILRGLRKRLDPKRRSLAEPYRTVYPYTQCHLVRQENLVRLAGLVEHQHVPGAIVECGVLDGGMAALVASRTKDRPIHLFDSWQGLPDSTATDGDDARKWQGQVVGSMKRVRNVMRKLAVDESRLHLHRGWFQDTFPTVHIDPIALLHVDCDFYEATKLCLSHWWDHISPGGCIQIDDYPDFQGCVQAVDEFIASKPGLQLQSVGQFAKAHFIHKP